MMVQMHCRPGIVSRLLDYMEMHQRFTEAKQA